MFLYILRYYWQIVKENSSMSSFNFFYEKRPFFVLPLSYLD